MPNGLSTGLAIPVNLSPLDNCTEGCRAPRRSGACSLPQGAHTASSGTQSTEHCTRAWLGTCGHTRLRFLSPPSSPNLESPKQKTAKHHSLPRHGSLCFANHRSTIASVQALEHCEAALPTVSCAPRAGPAPCSSSVWSFVRWSGIATSISPRIPRRRPAGIAVMNGHFSAVGSTGHSFEHGVQVVDEDKEFKYARSLSLPHCPAHPTRTSTATPAIAADTVTTAQT